MGTLFRRVTTRQPPQFLFMGIEIRKIFMPSDMIPMDMRGNSRNQLVCQLHHLIINITDPKPRIDQQTPPGTIQQITMCFLPMPVFADDISILI